ncbi:MAG: TauD/TfdA family dioxygenase [Rhodospirillaceae bacterium]|nr:TauD/TfdA family dioxygenase [Rhodospirillaceae bacterium]
MSEITHQDTTVIDRDFAGPIAWRGATLGAEDGVVRLDQSCLDELDAVVAEVRANPLPTLMMTPDLFDMPACSATMATVNREIRQGLGFVIVDRLPMDRYSRDEAVMLYWLLSSIISRPVAQSWDGKMIYDVRDKGKPPGNGVRPDVTNVRQNFHTDNSYNLCAPHFLGLLCLQTAKSGGISRLISFAAAHNEMRKRHPDLLRRLYEPFYFDRQREHAPDDVMTTYHPMFENHDGELVARLSYRQVVYGYELEGKELDPEGKAALDAFEAILNEPAMWKDFYFEPGQI